MEHNLIDVDLHFSGPYRIIGDNRLVFTSPEAVSCGVYLWVIPSRTDLGWIHYVGETTKPFALRFSEHLGAQVSGRYTVYNIEALRDGNPNSRLWQGYGWRSNSSKLMSQFMIEWSALRSPLCAYLDACEVMLGVLDPTLGCTKRVESALLRHLRAYGGNIAAMVKGNRCNNYNPDDRRFRISMNTERPLHGFPSIPLDA